MQCNVIHICSVSTFLICSIIFYLFSRVAINLLVGRMLARAARLRCQGPQIARGRGWPRELVISSKFWSLGMCQKWVWVNTYRYIFSGMNIHYLHQLFWGSLGTRVLTHPQMAWNFNCGKGVTLKKFNGSMGQTGQPSLGSEPSKIALVCI